MKNEAERFKLICDRVLEAVSSKEFKHQMMHHTDLPIHRIERIGGRVWITLKDGSYYKVEPYVSLSPVKVEVRNDS